MERLGCFGLWETVRGGNICQGAVVFTLLSHLSLLFRADNC
jgi:hypothetical protein